MEFSKGIGISWTNLKFRFSLVSVLQVPTPYNSNCLYIHPQSTRVPAFVHVGPLLSAVLSMDVSVGSTGTNSTNVSASWRLARFASNALCLSFELNRGCLDQTWQPFLPARTDKRPPPPRFLRGCCSQVGRACAVSVLFLLGR